MGRRAVTLLLDTHALLWLDAEPERLSRVATEAVNEAAELAVASVTWYELARLAEKGRVLTSAPIRTWLADLSREIHSVGVTPGIAATAVALHPSFPGDPIDRIIYATAIEHGWQLVTKDRQMHDYPQPRPVTIW